VAKVRTPRTAWIDAAMEAIGEGGPDAVRVEALATRIGVTKGGFYWHFKDRRALLEEVLDAWERGSNDVIATVDAEPGDARAKLRRLFEMTPAASGYFTVDLAVRDWSRRDRAVAKRLRRVDARRLEWLRSLFAEICAGEEEAEARSMLAYSLLIGSYFFSAEHDGKSRAEMLRLATDHLLAGARSGG
jgi:AcrR family transcriptional regulator